MEEPTTACIIGGGPGGIAMGYHLKKTLKCDDFTIVDQNAGVGGTWYLNSYPGCGMVSSFSKLRQRKSKLLSGIRL
jgi:cation diffusion facilitator CzcD-associated flavoprotein CzcO